MVNLPRYRGFSTASYLEGDSKSLAMSNQDVVKQDLLNFIYTIPGERVHLPTFGTRIPMLAFEPLDQMTITIVEDDLKKAIAYDPRLRLIDMSVNAVPDNNMIVAFVDVEYIELNTIETIKLDFGVGS